MDYLIAIIVDAIKTVDGNKGSLEYVNKIINNHKKKIDR